MSLARLASLCLASLFVVSGCAQSPTGPTSLAPSAALGDLRQVSTPVPPRLSINPPRALGVTRFVAFGDSITWGAYSSWDQRFLYAAANGGYPERLQAGLANYYTNQQFTVFNEGLPAELALNALSRFRSMLTSRRPEAVLLLEGINDLNTDFSPSRTASALRQMIDAATSAGVPVLVATMYQTYVVTDPNGNERQNAASVVPAFNEEVRRVATGRLNVHLVDIEPLMRDRRYVGNDGLHLTDEGFERLASAFLQAIETAFPVRGSFH